MDDEEYVKLINELFDSREEYAKWLEMRFPSEMPTFGNRKLKKTDFSEWQTDTLKG